MRGIIVFEDQGEDEDVLWDKIKYWFRCGFIETESLGNQFFLISLGPGPLFVAMSLFFVFGLS